MDYEKLKQELFLELDFYGRCAKDIERRMWEVPKGRKLFRDYCNKYIFYRGQESAIRNLLSILGEMNLE